MRNRGRQAKRAIRRDDVRTLVTALKANEPVWYAPDQSYRKKGAEMVPFFNIPAATNTATSRLARMTGAAVLPYFPERLPGSQGYRMVIYPMLENFPTDDPAADAQRFNELIEAQVRHVPEQYLWIHRRFKGLSPDYPDYYGRRSDGKRSAELTTTRCATHCSAVTQPPIDFLTASRSLPSANRHSRRRTPHRAAAA